MNYIYLLRCPLSGAVRYIGRSTQPSQRLYHHVHRAKKYVDDDIHCRWIRRLLARGTTPQMRILLSLPHEHDWGMAERFVIASAKYLGFRLTNISLGGRGVGLLPPEIEQARLANSQRAFALPEILAKRGESIKASWADPARRAKTIAAMKASAATPERRAAILAAVRIPRSPEAKARQQAGAQKYFERLREEKRKRQQD